MDAEAAWAAVRASFDDTASDDASAVQTASPKAVAAVVAAPAPASALLGWEDLGDAWAADGDAAFLAKLLALSATLAYFAGRIYRGRVVAATPRLRRGYSVETESQRRGRSVETGARLSGTPSNTRRR